MPSISITEQEVVYFLLPKIVAGTQCALSDAVSVKTLGDVYEVVISPPH